MANMAGRRLASMAIPGATPISPAMATIAVRGTAAAAIDGQAPFILLQSRIDLRDSRRGMTIGLNKGREP